MGVLIWGRSVRSIHQSCMPIIINPTSGGCRVTVYNLISSQVRPASCCHWFSLQSLLERAHSHLIAWRCNVRVNENKELMKRTRLYICGQVFERHTTIHRWLAWQHAFCLFTWWPHASTICLQGCEADLVWRHAVDDGQKSVQCPPVLLPAFITVHGCSAVHLSMQVRHWRGQSCRVVSFCL